MKKQQPDNYLYLLKKVHGWCKRQGMTDPEMYFQYEDITVIRNHGGIISIRCYYPI